MSLMLSYTPLKVLENQRALRSALQIIDTKKVLKNEPSKICG